MKKISAIVGAIVLGLSVNVMAAGGHYGAPKNLTNNLKGTYGAVEVVNHTYDEYTSQEDDGEKTYIGPVGSGYDVYTYEHPVCLTITRNWDHALTYQGCINSGVVNIGPYALQTKMTKNSKNKALPPVKVTTLK